MCREHIAHSAGALGVFHEHTEDGSDMPQWATFSRALRQEEEAWKRRRVSETRRRWSGAAAIAATLVVAIIWQRQAEVTLSAETVISRAVAYEQQQPQPGARPLWIRHSADPQSRYRSQHTRAQPADFDDSVSEPLAPTTAAAQELARRLAEYGFDSTAPLSARHFQQWRRSTTPQEQLQSLDGALLKVSASASVGDVEQAELIVREGTYEPVSQHWMFADGFRVAVTSLPGTARPREELRAATDVRPVSPTPTRPLIDLQATELAVRTALYDARVPVGARVTVARVDNHILVQGDVAASEKVAKIHAYARQTEGVRVQVRMQPPPSFSDDDRDSPDLRLWLEQALPTAERRDQFLTETLGLDNQLRTAVAVLADLARRYPPALAAKLAPHQQTVLTALARRQFLDITTAYASLEQHLAALVGTISRPTMPTELPPDWQVRGLAADQQVSSLSTTLNVVLAHTSSHPEDFMSFARAQVRPNLEAVAAAIAGPPSTP